MLNGKPLCIDVFCGLGGWSQGFIENGYTVFGFDIEKHVYGSDRYPGQLILQDALTLRGRQFKHADCLVMSPPCQKYSWLAMPWSRSQSSACKACGGKGSFQGIADSLVFSEIPCVKCGGRGFIENSKAAKALRKDWETNGPDNRLFNACFEIQKDACRAAGRYIPMVVENVRGAQEWVGPAKANFGSFYLWGDVAMVGNRIVAGSAAFGNTMRIQADPKVPGFRFDGSGGSFQTASVLAGKKIGGDWFSDPNSTCRKHGSKSPARKAASAQIARIPLELSRYIARSFLSQKEAAA